MEQIEEEQPREEQQEVLDPVESERKYWREPLTGIVREVWRPGRNPPKT